MNNISNYLEFINEATLGIDKAKIDYQLSRPGRDKAFVYSNSTDLESFNIKFEYTLESPDDTDDVLLIRPSSFLKINYLKLKEMEELNDGDFMVYKLISDDINIKWAVAKIGQKTTVLKQFDRTGASKRGDYFRETAFLIRLAELAWINKGVKLKIYSNRGQIEMVYSKNKQGEPKAYMSPRYNTKEFINTYDTFKKETHKDILSTMDAHCVELIKYLGESIEKVKYIIKNSSTNLINLMALNLMRQDAITKTRLAIETEFEFDIPANANVSKWNPSDLWIVFDDRYFKSEKSYQNIDNIDQLNKFLYDSLEGKSGVVGVSLKMSRKDTKKDTKEEDTGKYKHLYKITKDTRLVNRFKDFDISNNKKTAEIDFEFKNKFDEWKEGSGIDCRTFDTNNKSSISLEVKGKKGAGYVSGKAGSIIDYLLPEYYLNIKNILKKETSKETIRTALNIDFDKIENGYPGYKPAYLPENEKLKKVFLKDLEGEDPKNSNENSRLQSVVFFDWLLRLKDNQRNEVITTVVRYAKSESLWSAPHLALK